MRFILIPGPIEYSPRCFIRFPKPYEPPQICAPSSACLRPWTATTMQPSAARSSPGPSGGVLHDALDVRGCDVPDEIAHCAMKVSTCNTHASVDNRFSCRGVAHTFLVYPSHGTKHNSEDPGDIYEISLRWSKWVCIYPRIAMGNVKLREIIPMTACLQHYASLPTKGKPVGPREWTVMAAFVLEDTKAHTLQVND